MKISISFFIVLVVMLVVAVPAYDDKIVWKPITPRELAMDKPQVDPEADAEAIFWEVRIDDSKRTKLSRDYYIRVKIFTDLGREDFSKFNIPYSKRYRIKNIAARVIRPDGSIVAIQDSDIFDRDIVKTDKRKYKAKSFAIPNIEPGVIVEYQYTEVIKNASAVGMELELQKDIPVQVLSYYYKPYKKNKPEFRPYNFGTEETDFVETEDGFYLAQRQNVPAFKEEPYMPPSGMVRPWMQLTRLEFNIAMLSSRRWSISIKDSNNPRQFWSAFAAEKRRLIEGLTKKDKKIIKEAERVVAGAATPAEKLSALYKYCQTEIHNISFDPDITEEEIDDLPTLRKMSDVLKVKKASSRIIDYMFGVMADSLGFDIAFVYSGDRSEMFFDISMTNEEFVHFAAVGVKDGLKWKFFNPGVPFLEEGQLLWNEEKVVAILADKEAGSFQEMPFQDVDKTNTKRTGKFTLQEDGTLTGDIKLELTGHKAIGYRAGNYDTGKAKREEDLKDDVVRRISTAEVSNISIENFEDISKPIVQRYRVKVPNYAQKTGKRMFFQPGFFGFGTSARFVSQDRKYDVAFDYPWSENDELEIILPKGYTLDNATGPAPLMDSSGVGSLKVSLRNDIDRGILYYNREFYFGKDGRITFPVRLYPAIKQMFDGFHKSDTHTLSIKADAVAE